MQRAYSSVAFPRGACERRLTVFWGAKLVSYMATVYVRRC